MGRLTNGECLSFGPPYKPYFYVKPEFFEALVSVDNDTSSADAYRYVRVDNAENKLASPYIVIAGTASVEKLDDNSFFFHFSAEKRTKDPWKLPDARPTLDNF